MPEIIQHRYRHIFFVAFVADDLCKILKFKFIFCRRGQCRNSNGNDQEFESYQHSMMS